MKFNFFVRCAAILLGVLGSGITSWALDLTSETKPRAHLTWNLIQGTQPVLTFCELTESGQVGCVMAEIPAQVLCARSHEGLYSAPVRGLVRNRAWTCQLPMDRDKLHQVWMVKLTNRRGDVSLWQLSGATAEQMLGLYRAEMRASKLPWNGIRSMEARTLSSAVFFGPPVLTAESGLEFLIDWNLETRFWGSMRSKAFFKAHAPRGVGFAGFGHRVMPLALFSVSVGVDLDYAMAWGADEFAVSAFEGGPVAVGKFSPRWAWEARYLFRWPVSVSGFREDTRALISVRSGPWRDLWTFALGTGYQSRVWGSAVRESGLLLETSLGLKF